MVQIKTETRLNTAAAKGTEIIFEAAVAEEAASPMLLLLYV